MLGQQIHAFFYLIDSNQWLSYLFVVINLDSYQ